MSTAKRIGGEYVAQIVAFAVAIADRLFIPAILIRYLGVAEFSAWSIAIATGAFVSVLEFGLTRYYMNRLIYLVERGELEEARRLFRVAATYIMVLVGVALVAIAIAYPLIAPGVGDPVLDDILPGVVLPITLAAAALQLLAMRQALYRAHRHFTAETYIRLLGEAARIAVAVGSAWIGASLLAVSWLWLAATLAFVIVPISLHTARRYRGFAEKPIRPPEGELSGAAKVAPGLWLQSMFTTLYASLPVLAISALATGPTMITQFVLMRTIANFVRQVQQMFANLFAIELARRAANGDHAGHAQIFTEANRLLGVQAAVSSATLFVLGEWLFGLWTGRPALFDMWLLVFAVAPPLLVPASTLSMEALAYANRPWPIVKARVAQAVLTAALFFALPFASIELRMMAALAIGEVIGLGLPLVYAITALNPMIAKRTIAGLTVLVVMTALASCAAIYAVRFADWLGPTLRAPLALLFAALITLLTSVYIGLSRVRRQQLWSFVRGLLPSAG